MVLCNQQLTESQWQDFEQLCRLCEASDGGLPALYLHLLSQKRDAKSNILYYEKDVLVGFVSGYFFYEDGCEISLMVSPCYRKKGIAAQLLSTLLPLLISKGLRRVIFSSSGAFRSHWQPSAELAYQHTEYRMERDGLDRIPIINPSLMIRQAILSDITVLCELDSACFFTDQSSVVTRLNYLLKDNNYVLLVACHDNNIIGKAHIRWENEIALLSDIAIFPDQQNRGFGSELLAFCINFSLSNGRTQLALDVETNNQGALNLYKKNGFNVVKSYDYWSMPLDVLAAFLQFR